MIAALAPVTLAACGEGVIKLVVQSVVEADTTTALVAPPSMPSSLAAATRAKVSKETVILRIGCLRPIRKLERKQMVAGLTR